MVHSSSTSAGMKRMELGRRTPFRPAHQHNTLAPSRLVFDWRMGNEPNGGRPPTANLAAVRDRPARHKRAKRPTGTQCCSKRRVSAAAEGPFPRAGPALDKKTGIRRTLQNHRELGVNQGMSSRQGNMYCKAICQQHEEGDNMPGRDHQRQERGAHPGRPQNRNRPTPPQLPQRRRPLRCSIESSRYR